MDEGNKGKKRTRGLDEEVIGITSKKQRVTMKTIEGKTYKIDLEALQECGSGSEYIESLLHSMLTEEKDSIDYPGNPLIPLFFSGDLNTFKTQLSKLLSQNDSQSRQEFWSLTMEIAGIDLQHLWIEFCNAFLLHLKIRLTKSNPKFFDYTTAKRKMTNYFSEIEHHPNRIQSLVNRILSNSNWYMLLRGHWNSTCPESRLHSPTSVDFSSDGNYIVSGSRCNRVHVWNAVSGKKWGELRGHTSIVTSVAFSPDGKRIVSGSLDETVRVWDTVSGKKRGELRGHTDWVNHVAFSPDGNHIVSGSEDGTVRTWNVSSGKSELTIKVGDEPVTCVAFSPDAKYIASVGWDVVHVWNARSGGKEFELTTKNVMSVAFSPDSKRIVSGNENGMVRVWDVASRELELLLEGHNGCTSSVGFSPDGKHIVSGAYDGKVNIWNAGSGKEELTLQLEKETVTLAAFSPDGKRIVSASEKRYHDGVVELSPDGKRIVSTNEKRRRGGVYIWNVAQFC
jgi:WD40 repeat protein